MAVVSKPYGVEDTVYVAFPFPHANYFQAIEKVVAEVRTLGGTNEARVFFTDGTQVQDGAVQTVYTTEALASTAIVNDVISRSAAAVALDADLSVASTASNPSTTLGRIG